MKHDDAGRPPAPFAPIDTPAGRGLRLQHLDPDALAAALSACGNEGVPPGWILLKAGDRTRVFAGPAGGDPLVIKVSADAGLLRRLADALRGSPARRAWRGGHGLRARGIAAATPCAFVERRRLGLPVGSAVAFEDLRRLHPADACSPDFAGPAEVVDAVIDLAIHLHRQNVVHGDLKASHVLLGRVAGRLVPRLIDLEAVRFRWRLGDRARMRALAQLNASLPDAIDDHLRCAAFERYAAALPFGGGAGSASRARAEIVSMSLARRHRWTGPGCADARLRAPDRETING